MIVAGEDTAFAVLSSRSQVGIGMVAYRPVRLGFLFEYRLLHVFFLVFSRLCVEIERGSFCIKVDGLAAFGIFGNGLEFLGDAANRLWIGNVALLHFLIGLC